MSVPEKYVEPQAPGHTGDEADSVRIAYILNGLAVPGGAFLAGIGLYSLSKEVYRHGQGAGGGEAGSSVAGLGLPAGDAGVFAILTSGSCLIAASGLFLAVLGVVGLMALRHLCRGRRAPR